MLSGIKPLAIIKRQAKELLPPKLVDRLIYAAKNFPEIGWLEILPKEEGKEVRETYIVYESLERAFQRIRPGSIRQISRRTSRAERSARRLNWLLDSRIKTGQSPVGSQQKFHVIST
jgi:hypothetical protein